MYFAFLPSAVQKLLLASFLAWLSVLPAAAQDLPTYADPQQSPTDPDVWLVTRPRTGQRAIELFYAPLPDILAANAQQADRQQLPPADRRAKLHHDSTDYAGGLLFIAATCPGRTTIDGALRVVVLDEQRREVLLRTLNCTEAELSINSETFGRMYAVPITQPLPPNAVVVVEDVPAREHHAFLIRPEQK